MSNLTPRSGFTLPVFACAGAIAALRWLYDQTARDQVSVQLLRPSQTVEISLEQVGGLGAGQSLGITRSDPGDNLDLTRHTPIWTLVSWADPDQQEPIRLRGGAGVGIDRHRGDQAAIYAYAQELMYENLRPWLQKSDRIQVTVSLPEGRALAERTSNAAFGVVEGLSLLGTTGIAQPHSSAQQLDRYRRELRQKSQGQDCLVFCIGENGLDLAASLGIAPEAVIKTANWLGPLLVEAGLQGIGSILLLGYHGKLIKLAGGIFHTHHHLADARQEIITAYAANLGLPLPSVQALLNSPTAEAALQRLTDLDAKTGSHWVESVYQDLTRQIDARSQTYIRQQCDRTVRVGSALFNRDRKIFSRSEIGAELLHLLCQQPQD
ncbi:MAG: cobalt-precorrin-5B (C(1))-methyltransferase [Acaryochloridaceae cyanobacterium SU_2_1]|nr:cobalt-precorrin-5B (C(1))-methyltransferase [Acaryochloridaceae cyanobacterium SU_2_1]